MFLRTSLLPILALLHIASAAHWQQLASLPSPRQEHTVAFLPPDTIAVIGGIALVPNSTATTTTDLVEFYSIHYNSWSTAHPLPIPLNHPNAAVVDDKLYVLGGLQQTPTAWSSVPNCWVYDLKMNVWKEIASMSDARGSAAVGVWDGKVLLAGGLKQIQTVAPYGQDTVDTVSIYDTKVNTWTTVAEPAAKLPDTRDHAAATVIDNRFYIVGGRERGQLRGKNTTLILDLDHLDDGWEVSSSLMPTGRSGLVASPIGKSIYSFGGEGNLEHESGVFNSSERYDIENNQWTGLDIMKLPRHGTAAVTVDGKIYVPGGGIKFGVGPTDYFDFFALEV